VADEEDSKEEDAEEVDDDELGLDCSEFVS
jgi:hypothetical protein